MGFQAFMANRPTCYLRPSVFSSHLGAFPVLSMHSLTAGTRVEASCPLSNNFAAPKLRARLSVSASFTPTLQANMTRENGL
jgi:hypothetical protein